MAPDRPPVVVFVAGWGRSGSTVLEQLLAHLPGTVGIGEVWNLWGKGFEKGEPCGCGEPVPACPFWKDVASRAFGGVDAVDGHAVARRMREVARMRNVLALLGRRSDPRLAEHREQLGRLYRAVAEVSGASVIVDTSKNPQHGFVLDGVAGIEVAVVHLVRDARAVAFSWSRSKPVAPGDDRRLPRRAPSRSATSWIATNFAAELLRLARRGRPTLRVRYEDLCADPADVIARIAALTGRPADDAAGALAGGRPVVHAGAGNPVRLDRGPVVLRLDDEWARARWRGRGVVTALAAPLLLRYGYRLRVRP